MILIIHLAKNGNRARKASSIAITCASSLADHQVIEFKSLDSAWPRLVPVTTTSLGEFRLERLTLPAGMDCSLLAMNQLWNQLAPF